MPPRDWKLRIRDILDCISKIDRYTDGMGLAEFEADEKTIDAVVRNIEVIGEAATHIPDEIQAGYPDLPWPEMRAMRNILAHEYFGVSLPIIWQTIQDNLPPLAEPLEEILRKKR